MCAGVAWAAGLLHPHAVLLLTAQRLPGWLEPQVTLLDGLQLQRQGLQAALVRDVRDPPAEAAIWPEPPL